MGIKNIEKMNISLLTKWWWKLEHEEGLWQDIVNYKYLSRDDIHSVSHKLGDSPIWTDLLKVKYIYLQGKSVKIENGNLVRFWEDAWLSDSPLCTLVLVLYALCDQKGVRVADAKNGNTLISFRIWLHDDLCVIWDLIWAKVQEFLLFDVPDQIGWRLGKKGIFSVKSVYEALTKTESG